MSQPLETISVVEAATMRLRESLFAGDYVAGEEVKDTQISKAYGIARPTARIAVQQLINEGMLVRPAGLSARVRTFDPAEVRDLYRVRRLFELDAVRDINAHQKPLDRVEAALQGFAELPDDADWAQVAKADVEFHVAVVESADSPRLQQYFSGITSEVRLLIALLKKQYQGGRELYAEHEELFHLLGSADSGDELERAWVAHLVSAQEFLESHLAEM